MRRLIKKIQAKQQKIEDVNECFEVYMDGTISEVHRVTVVPSFMNGQYVRVFKDDTKQDIIKKMQSWKQ